MTGTLLGSNDDMTPKNNNNMIVHPSDFSDRSVAVLTSNVARDHENNNERLNSEREKRFYELFTKNNEALCNSEVHAIDTLLSTKDISQQLEKLGAQVATAIDDMANIRAEKENPADKTKYPFLIMKDHVLQLKGQARRSEVPVKIDSSCNQLSSLQSQLIDFSDQYHVAEQSLVEEIQRTERLWKSTKVPQDNALGEMSSERF